MADARLQMVENVKSALSAYGKEASPDCAPAEFIADQLMAAGAVIPVRCHKCRKWDAEDLDTSEYGICYRNGFSRGTTKHRDGFCDKGIEDY